jgi:hypothetical protein
VIVVGLVLVVDIGHGTRERRTSAFPSTTSVTGPPVTADPNSTALPPLQGALPPGLSATPAQPGLLVDDASAATVVEALMPLRMDALRRNDVASLERLETGDALQLDRNGKSYDLPTPDSVRYGSSLGPPQDHYPVYFVAEVRWMSPAGQSTVDLVVITRADAASTWKLSLEAAFNWDDPILFLDAPATGAFHGGLPNTAAEAQSLPSAMADYWQSWADRAQPPERSPFTTAGPLLSQGEKIVDARRGFAARGITRTVHYEAGPNVYSFAMYGDTTLVCGSVHWHSETTPGPGGVLEQSQDESTWGSPLPPGRYSSIHSDGLRQSCFVAGDGFDNVLGQVGSVYAQTGEPAR